MPKINLEFYVYALFMVIFVAMTAILLVMKTLQNKELSFPALHTYYLYFASGIGGFLVLAIKDGIGLTFELSITIITFIVSSFILLLAVGEFPNQSKGKIVIQLTHLALVAVSLFISNIAYQILFLSIYIIATYSLISYFSMYTAKRERNIGSSIIGFTSMVMVITGFTMLYLFIGLHNIAYVYYVSVISSATGFLLVGIGVLALILIRQYQQLSQLATQDPLTGLLNRRGMEHALLLSIGAAKRFGRFISVIALDVDFFKKINDRYGHDAGDAVLVEISKVLSATARKSDVCCRIGGEEFLIVLPDTDTKGVMAAAQRVHQSVSAMSVHHGSHIITATCSIGIATQKGDITIETLLKEGDEALYQAKEIERNQICTVAR